MDKYYMSYVNAQYVAIATNKSINYIIESTRYVETTYNRYMPGMLKRNFKYLITGVDILLQPIFINFSAIWSFISIFLASIGLHQFCYNRTFNINNNDRNIEVWNTKPGSWKTVHFPNAVSVRQYITM